MDKQNCFKRVISKLKMIYMGLIQKSLDLTSYFRFHDLTSYFRVCVVGGNNVKLKNSLN